MSPSSRYERWEVSCCGRSQRENVLVEAGHSGDEEFLVRILRRLAELSGQTSPAVIVERIQRTGIDVQ